MSSTPKEPWEIRMLREYRADGWTHAELAWFFEMSQSAVSKACKGESYKYVDGPIETGYNRRS